MKMLGEDPPGLPESPPAPAPAWTAGIRQVRPVLPQLRPAGLVVVDSVLHRNNRKSFINFGAVEVVELDCNFGEK
ncbi:hypothetical protein EJB05_23179 [Eragrostis curvula]|uniref:Uncharacterized protein n=1 Tax=Eragrostis curvula TaxID=38414 RepID=A0A5J9V5K9_9POAL|nr:hypothetical protein EJB05_23179 [Eragrostis curvula]